MSFERMLDKATPPTPESIAAYLGKKAAVAWDDITVFLAENYDFTPEHVFWGKKHGWNIRYRRSGKTLGSLFPEKGAFSVLIVLGAKESELALAALADFSPGAAAAINDTPQLHDGRWLWLRVRGKEDTADVKRLLRIKKKPRK